MSASVITLVRIILSIVAICLFQLGFFGRVAALLLTILVFVMDSLDGYIARKFGLESDFGAMFDIASDRIIENIYWIFFTAIGMVSLWVPIIFITRSFLVDAVRNIAFTKEGKTAFGEKTMMKSKFTNFLTSSPFMRWSYAFMKVSAFFLLGCILIYEASDPAWTSWLSQDLLNYYKIFTTSFVWATVAVNLVRGIPVLWDGRHYFSSDHFQGVPKATG